MEEWEETEKDVEQKFYSTDVRGSSGQSLGKMWVSWLSFFTLLTFSAKWPKTFKFI